MMDDSEFAELAAVMEEMFYSLRKSFALLDAELSDRVWLEIRLGRWQWIVQWLPDWAVMRICDKARRKSRYATPTP